MEAHELRALVETALRNGDKLGARVYAVALSFLVAGHRDEAERMVARLEGDRR